MEQATRVQSLLEQVVAALAAGRRFPGSTYRLQFHAGFTFQDARAIVPYLHELGVTDCYASPYLKARPGSKHGYDICDHRALNPEIGSEEDYEAWVQALHAHGMGQLLDMVPNHMGIVGNENAWWNDVLDNGPGSPYAGYFDIEWYPIKPDLDEKVLLPILGDPFGKVLESGQIRLANGSGAFAIHYFDHRFPVAPRTWSRILRHRLPELEQALGAEAPELMEYQSILTAIEHLPGRNETDPERVTMRHREKEVIKRRLMALAESAPAVRAFIAENVGIFNGRVGDPRSFDLLDELLSEQAYRLSYWRVASDEINYRRFFDINELAALSMERPEVFAATHERVLRLLRERKITGLRIDHPDGLYDPCQYLERLQQHYVLETARSIYEKEAATNGQTWKELEGPLLEAIATAGPGSPLAKALYVVVEKILGKGESLREGWPIHGTTGYTFLNRVNSLFVDGNHARAFTRIYERFIGGELLFRDLVYQKKFLILQVSLASELHMLAHQLDRLSEKNRWSRDFTLNSLRHALREIIACFPVYRSYISERGIQPADQAYIETAVRRAKLMNPAISSSIFDFVRDVLLLKYRDSDSEADRAEQRRFVGKFQQLTGPVMAKGLEDTAFYIYNRLVSLNEVGGEPTSFGMSVEAFHQYLAVRQAHWPHALSATSTHDTKRSEDVRARINVLSEMPNVWQKAVLRWRRLNKKHRVEREEGVSHLSQFVAPDPNDEYLFYQTLVGAWPIEPPSPPPLSPSEGEGRLSGEEYAGFVRRMQQYMQKAVHEAKVHTSWINPNPTYDEAVDRFVARVLDERLSGKFLREFRELHRRISPCGLFNSLSQLLLKIAAPGAPDLYQGTELWDFSLVDPDNRRPVDYQLRRQLLDSLKKEVTARGDELTALARELVRTKEDGRIKLYVTYRALNCRRERADLFSTGEYLPCQTTGTRREHVVAFVRRNRNGWALAAVPRLLTRLMPGPDDLPLGEKTWEDAAVILPATPLTGRCRNIFTGDVLTVGRVENQPVLPAAQIFKSFPVALLIEA